jgi:hypothetical protein
MIVLVSPNIGTTEIYLSYKGLDVKCCIGSGGLILDKKEGDGCTPIGSWPLRRVFYRPDKGKRPITGLPIFKITRKMGWCDDPKSKLYNQEIKINKQKVHHEKLFIKDMILEMLETEFQSEEMSLLNFEKMKRKIILLEQKGKSKNYIKNKFIERRLDTDIIEQIIDQVFIE